MLRQPPSRGLGAQVKVSFGSDYFGAYSTHENCLTKQMDRFYFSPCYQTTFIISSVG